MGRDECGFDAFSARPIFGRIHCKFFDRRGKARGKEMARDESGDEERRARAENLPAKTPLLRECRGQRINADLVSGRKDRARIELLVKSRCGAPSISTRELLPSPCGAASTRVI